jgi:hypothetical protein
MEQVISDPWVLKIVEEGLSLKFVSKPPKSGVRTTNLLNIVHTGMSNVVSFFERSQKLNFDPFCPGCLICVFDVDQRT